MLTTKEEIGEITQILSKWNEAKEESLDEVFPIVYKEFRRLAKTARRRTGRINSDETLCTTSLVNEMYVKLRKSEVLSFENSGRFYALCLLSMQNLLRDYYYKKSSKKHEVSFPDELFEDNLFYDSIESKIHFDELLAKLSEQHPKKVEMLRLKYEYGETNEEIAREFNISASKVRRDISNAEFALKREQAKSIAEKAADLTNTTLRVEYLEKASRGNQDLLKLLEIMLKEPRKE